MTSPWSRDLVVRRQALTEMANRFDSHADELGRLVTQENGKKLARGTFESSTAGMTLRHNAAQARTEAGISADFAPRQSFSQYLVPAGVVGIIIPWTRAPSGVPGPAGATPTLAYVRYVVWFQTTGRWCPKTIQQGSRRARGCFSTRPEPRPYRRYAVGPAHPYPGMKGRSRAPHGRFR